MLSDTIRFRPMEMSSKYPVPVHPMTIEKQPVTRDPRFVDLSGTYNEEQFKRSYKFIDRLKAKEFKVRIHVKPKHSSAFMPSSKAILVADCCRPRGDYTLLIIILYLTEPHCRPM